MLAQQIRPAKRFVAPECSGKAGVVISPFLEYEVMKGPI
jgi:hypothetical protein